MCVVVMTLPANVIAQNHVANAIKRTSDRNPGFAAAIMTSPVPLCGYQLWLNLIPARTEQLAGEGSTLPALLLVAGADARAPLIGPSAIKNIFNDEARN